MNTHEPSSVDVMEYYDRMASDMELFSWYRDEDITRLVGLLVPSYAESILDVGCGAGIFLEQLAQRLEGVQVTGTDISTEMVRRATERLAPFGGNVFCGNWIDALPEESRSFDAIVLKNVLHLIPSVSAALARLSEVSGNATTLVIVETVSPNPVCRDFIAELFHVLDPNSPKRNFFTEETLSAAIQRGGWRVTHDGRKSVRQSIDVNLWLKSKALSTGHLAQAMRHLCGASREIRDAMAFEPNKAQMVPRRMLRLQAVRRVVRPSVVVSRADDSVQLDLPINSLQRGPFDPIA